MVPPPSTVTLLYFEGCPLTPRLRENIRKAVAKLRAAHRFEEVDLSRLRPHDPRLRYGSPTVLVGGRDLLGLNPAEQAGLACRPYPDGLPTTERLVELLAAAAAR